SNCACVSVCVTSGLSTRARVTVSPTASRGTYSTLSMTTRSNLPNRTRELRRGMGAGGGGWMSSFATGLSLTSAAHDGVGRDLHALRQSQRSGPDQPDDGAERLPAQTAGAAQRADGGRAVQIGDQPFDRRVMLGNRKSPG